MKKLFYLALAVIPFAFASCDVEKEGGDDSANATVLEGTWYYADSHHPFTFVFKGNTYTFETPGFKDTGTFTYNDGVIKCNIQQRWSSDTGWEGDVRVSVGEWESIPLEGYTSRTFEVTLLENGVCIGNLIDEFYGGEAREIFLICKGAKISIDASKLNGEWIFKGVSNVIARLLVDGNNYTVWVADPYYRELAATKEAGEWSYADGYLTLSPETLLFSYTYNDSIHNYDYSTVNPQTLEADEWYEAEYDLDETKVPAYLSNGTFYVQMDEMRISKFTKK